MKPIQVRCWEVEVRLPFEAKAHYLTISYPEGNSGHDLICCLACGQVYAVTVAKEVYQGPPLKEKLVGLCCERCGRDLSEGFAYYPETYIHAGRRYEYQRSPEIPGESDSIIRIFPGIYE